MKPSEVPFWTNASLPVKGRLVLVLPLAALLVTLVLAWWVVGQERDNQGGVLQAMQVHTGVSEISALLASADAGVHEYLLTGKSQYLDKYAQAQNRLAQ